MFALEHGLTEIELSLLSSAVKDAVGRGHLPIAASLPFVVYATEIGYDYSGDEYWQTFSQQTPGWSKIEDRDFIRQGFQRFARSLRRRHPGRPVGPALFDHLLAHNPRGTAHRPPAAACPPALRVPNRTD